MGVYVIAVLSFFPSGISVILILMCGIGYHPALRHTVFLSFRLYTYYIRYSVKEDPSRYCSAVHMRSPAV